MDFGDFFKEKRQDKNLTQKDLAKLLFVSESAVSKWERNIAHPDITLLPKLAEILGVTEHELITASIDKNSREEKKQAKKWRVVSLTWSVFFYISYALALIPCFICNLAINKTLSWFWIVFAALLLAFTFTNLPKLIKKHKLILLPVAMYSALCLLLGVCCIYSGGNWFLIPAIAVLFVLIMIFMPIYIAQYDCFSKIRKYNDFVSVAVDFVLLNILLLVIESFTVSSGGNYWYFSLALPIAVVIYLFISLLMCVRFLKLNKLLKTSIILFVIDLIYVFTPLVKASNLSIQKELQDINVFKADFSKWIADFTIEQNIHCIIALTLLSLSLIFFTFGLISHFKKKKLKQ